MKRTATRFPGDDAFINKDTFTMYCNTNASVLKEPVRGIAVEFPGLGGGSCLGGSPDPADYCTEHARYLGERGILHVYMFSGPWSWMNRGAVRMTDNVIAAAKDRYGLSDDAPVAVLGGSMGGLGALIYCVYGENIPVACAAACPCVDVRKQMNVLFHFPRTYVSAVLSCDMPIAQGLDTISPAAHTDDMPAIPYMILNDCADELFAEADTDAYTEKLLALGHDIDYVKLPGCRHGEIPKEVKDGLYRFIGGHIEAHAGRQG